MIKNKLQNKTKQKKTINNNLNQILSIQNFSSQVDWKKKWKGWIKSIEAFDIWKANKKQTLQKRTKTLIQLLCCTPLASNDYFLGFFKF